MGLLRIYALLIGLLAGACRPTPDDVPKSLIPREKMAAILTDIHLAEVKVTRLSKTADSANIVYKRLERQIYKKHGIDTATYTKSYIYYSSNPAEMTKVYERVIENLKRGTTTKRPADSTGAARRLNKIRIPGRL